MGQCYVVEFRVTLDQESHHMWFVYLERPASMALIQYDAYGTVFTLPKKQEQMKRHFDEAMASIRSL